jgi:hypothetical protein
VCHGARLAAAVATATAEEGGGDAAYPDGPRVLAVVRRLLLEHPVGVRPNLPPKVFEKFQVEVPTVGSSQAYSRVGGGPGRRATAPRIVVGAPPLAPHRCPGFWLLAPGRGGQVRLADAGPNFSCGAI